MKHLLLAILASAAASLAATTIEVNAKFADVPAGTDVPAKPELLAKSKGIDVLSAPRVTTKPGQPATIEVTQDTTAPDGSTVPLGVTLTINPTLTEKGSIAFTGKATDRFKHGQQSGETLSALAFVVRETYFKGVTTSGSTVLLKGSPATATTAKKDAAISAKNRELVIYLTFKKVTDEEPAGKKPAPSTKSSNGKPAAKGTSTKSATQKKSSKR
jgi:hypothetical protein